MDNKELENNVELNENTNIQNASNNLVSPENDNSVTEINKEFNTEGESDSNVENNSNMDFQMPELKGNDSAPSFEEQVVQEVPPVTPVGQELGTADFSTIFNVASEEKQEQTQNVSQAPVVETPTIETPIIPQAESTQIQQAQPSTPKKDVFNSEERLLYEIKPEKEGNPIVVVLFFFMLFGTILALPYISKRIEYGQGGTPVVVPEPEEEEDDKYEFNKSSVRAQIGSLEFTNFVKSKDGNKYLLTFNITNTSERPYQFNKKYYVVMYEEENVVYRALIHSYDAIGSNAAAEITLTISERSYTNANKFKIEEIVESRYPEVRLIETDGEYEVMTCNYLNDEIKYYFLEDKLNKIRETYTDSRDSNTHYDEDKLEYQELSKKYNSIENFTSNFIVTNTDFTMINEFNHKDISDATLFSLKNYSFFRYMESKDIVSFEMEARGYTCS